MNNRQLKFRIWDKQDKSFLSEEYLKHFKVAIAWDGKNIYQNFICGDKKVDDEVIIQQYTGLKDSKGVEIYEGDIVEFKTPNHGNLVTDAVAFDNGSFILEDMLYNLSDMKVRVVGNIFETPELIETNE